MGYSINQAETALTLHVVKLYNSIIYGTSNGYKVLIWSIVTAKFETG